MIVYAQLYRKCFVIMQILDILAALGNRKWLLVLLKPGNSLGKVFSEHRNKIRVHGDLWPSEI